MSGKLKASIKFASSMILVLIAYLPTLQWMVDRWMLKESYYGHGFLIPLISLYILWQRRGLLKKTEIESSKIGFFIVAFGLLVHILCATLRIYFVSGFSFVFVIYGLVLFFFGKKMARNLIFPIFFLIAMIPLPLVLIGNLTVKLKLFVAQTATIILNNIGFPCIRDGSIIRMPNSFVAVEAPCSGLRSLISLITLGFLFAYAMKVSYVKKSLLFLSSIPIALASNLVRITLLAIVNDLYGEKIAMGFFHDFSGFLIFGVAFVGLFSVSRVLEKWENNA
ncbi:MAG: exosortase/archaeosortase family protein [Candidatus Omnitrophica bacterium]|nr:exosortase/archaeosortase family protein [Candidatus Omnitrophota bacterium]